MQLVFDRDFNFNRPFHFEIELSGPSILSQQIQSVRCLERLLRRKHFARTIYRSAPKPNASPDILYAIDLINSGLSHREIALRLYGEEAIKTGWDGTSDHVRTKTRRMIKKGRKLVENGCGAFFSNSRRKR